MSQENVEFVLDGYARYNAGERRPELWYWHEDAEYNVSGDDPDSEEQLGIDAIRKQTARWLEAYPDFKAEPLEAKENGDQVFLWVRLERATDQPIPVLDRVHRRLRVALGDFKPP